MEIDILYTLCYLMFCACIIYPPTEFQTAGVTIEAVFARILGSENEDFISYHIRRSSVTLIVFALLPLLYIQGLCLFCYEESMLLADLILNSFFWKVYFTFCMVLPILASLQVFLWYQNKWEQHPIMVNLRKFSTNDVDVSSIISAINVEYRRIEKVSLQINPISKVVATESWIIKVNLFNIYIADQSSVSLMVKHADTHNLSHQSSDSEVQFVNIEVTPANGNVEAFTVRINSMDFKDFQDRVARPIAIHPNVTFHKSVMDKFIDTFKEAVKNNPTYQTDQQLENCIGCFQSAPNVKIQKLCNDDTGEVCSACYCRPMWCVECMAKWFASRQDEEHLTTWLSSKCNCPMCRAKFCILDVCMISAD